MKFALALCALLFAVPASASSILYEFAKKGRVGLRLDGLILDETDNVRYPSMACLYGPLCPHIPDPPEYYSENLAKDHLYLDAAASNIWFWRDGFIYWDNDVDLREYSQHATFRLGKQSVTTVSGNESLTSVPLPGGMILLLSGLILLRRTLPASPIFRP